jgi:hypothetical protein
MTARVAVTRAAGPLETDPDTGEASRARRRVWRGPAYVRYPGLPAAEEPDVERSGFSPSPTRPLARFPVGAPIGPQDKIEVLADSANPGLAGLELEAVSVGRASQATTLVVVCRDWQKGAR